jgi:hypothetical protein
MSLGSKRLALHLGVRRCLEKHRILDVMPVRRSTHGSAHLREKGNA